MPLKSFVIARNIEVGEGDAAISGKNATWAWKSEALSQGETEVMKTIRVAVSFHIPNSIFPLPMLEVVR
jgi:hypothetical protein